MSIDPLNISVEALYEAAARTDVTAAMQEFYAETDRLIAERQATCWNRGECCRFGRFGHRLYVTAIEVCYYLAGVDAGSPAMDNAGTRHDDDSDVCPHAHGGICHVRSRRPLGCRVFFCDPAARDWQGPLTEERLAHLRTMHADLEVPYFYADWMTVLRAIRSYHDRV